MKKILPKDFKKGMYVRVGRKKIGLENGYMIITKSPHYIGMNINKVYSFRWSDWNIDESDSNSIPITNYIKDYNFYLLSQEEMDLINLGT